MEEKSKEIKNPRSLAVDALVPYLYTSGRVVYLKSSVDLYNSEGFINFCLGSRSSNKINIFNQRKGLSANNNESGFDFGTSPHYTRNISIYNLPF